MGGQVNDGTHRNISVPKGDMREQLFDENVKTEAGINKTGVCQLQDTFQHGGFKVFPLEGRQGLGPVQTRNESLLFPVSSISLHARWAS